MRRTVVIFEASQRSFAWTLLFSPPPVKQQPSEAARLLIYLWFTSLNLSFSVSLSRSLYCFFPLFSLPNFPAIILVEMPLTANRIELHLKGHQTNIKISVCFPLNSANHMCLKRRKTSTSDPQRGTGYSESPGEMKGGLFLYACEFMLVLFVCVNPAGLALQIQCYQCEEVKHNDCSTPEFIVNCTVNVQDMCQKEVLVKEDGKRHPLWCRESTRSPPTCPLPPCPPAPLSPVPGRLGRAVRPMCCLGSE